MGEKTLMATNNFKALGIGSGANVTSQSDYEALSALLTGFQSGKASSAQINKALRQATTVTAVLAQLIVDRTGADALDNGSTATLLANLKLALFSGTPLTGTPTAPTAPAGNVTTQLATTEFVKNAGLQVGNIFTVSSTSNMSVSYLGSSVLLSGAGGFTVTLPGSGNLSSGLYGKFITLLNVSSGDVVVSTVSADNITAGNNSVSSFTLKAGDRAIVYLASANYWHLLAGEASLRYSGSFGFSANQPGYQRLPSGIIIQWGITNNSSVNPQVVNLPVAFPNAGLVATASDFSGSYTPTTAIAICSARFISNNQMQVATASQSGTLAADSIQWIAIGY
jgi:hypothetical protein